MNANSGLTEYLKLCVQRIGLLVLSALAVFVTVLLTVRLMTPIQYTVEGTVRIQSDVEGESISDQYNISELSRSAALTSISLIDNSDTVYRAIVDTTGDRDADPVEYQKSAKVTQRNVTVRQIDQSNVLKVTVVYAGNRTEAETFTANLIKEANVSVKESFAMSTPSFSVAVQDAGRTVGVNHPWIIALGRALEGVVLTAVVFFIVNLFSLASDKTLRTSAKFETMTRVPVIAAIPPIAHIIGTERSQNQVSSAYRVLRSTIKYSKRGVRTIAVCSPSPRDGRTSVAIGLARALADSNAMVLLIEAEVPF